MNWAEAARSLERPAWFPDWHGRTVAIVASGPSTRPADAALLRGRVITLAIKENIEICPWAELVYGCDRAWWRNERGLPKYHGIKVTAHGPTAHEFPGVHLVRVDTSNNDKLLATPPGTLGSGGNSGFQALNLAIQCGARRIVLLGFDMSDQHGQHWYGANKGEGRTNPGPWNFGRWRTAFDRTLEFLAVHRVDVVNASPLTALTCYPKMPLPAALERMGA